MPQAQRPVGRHPMLQGLAAQQFHDHVGGAVGLEEIEHLHDRRRLVQAGQRSALVDEAAAAPVEIVGRLGRARQHRAVVLAHGQRGRQVFLDGDLAIELGVARTIGNAEAAVAQHARGPRSDRSGSPPARPHDRPSAGLRLERGVAAVM